MANFKDEKEKEESVVLTSLLLNVITVISLDILNMNLKNKTVTRISYIKGTKEILLMAYVTEKEANIKELWFLDYRRNNNMCCKREIFSNFKGNFREKVKLIDNSSMNMIDKDHVRIQVNGFV